MLNHVRQGRGEPLVLVHGIGSHLQMWSPVLDRLSSEHDVLALDLPGFGRSPQLGREPTVEALDAPQRTAIGRTLTVGHLIGRPWRMPAADAIRATHDLAGSPGFDATLPHVIDFDWTHGDLGVPVTIGWGTRDMLLIPRQARRARRRMPRARHVWLRGCGHVPTWDDPEQVAGVLLAGARDA